MEIKNKTKIVLLLQAFKFALVGAAGTITNLITFYISSDLLNININLASVMAFSIAVTQNFIGNKLWTFKSNQRFHFSVKEYFRFISASLVGLVVNLAILNFTLYIWIEIPLKVIAQLLGISFGLVFNFIFSKIFVFKTEKI